MPKPFNLERAQAGDKVVTRAGDPYKFGSYNKDANDCEKILGWINNAIVGHSENGTYWLDPEDKSPKDLFMADDEVIQREVYAHAHISDLKEFLDGKREGMTIISGKSLIDCNLSSKLVKLTWEE